MSLAKPTAKILLDEDTKSACSAEILYGFDKCWDNKLTKTITDAAGFTPPFVTNKGNDCDHTKEPKFVVQRGWTPMVFGPI